MDYKEVINKWKLNKAEIARRINMPDGTFKNKISDNPVYNFTEKEAKLIIDSLRELANDILSSDANYEVKFKIPEINNWGTLMTEPKKVIKVKELNKEGSKPYKPKEENPRFKIVNGKRVFK